MKHRKKKPISGSSSVKQYSFKNLQKCPQLRKEFVNTAIEHNFSEMLKMLQAGKSKQLIQDRNRMDIPHGMFGLKIEDFYERRQSDTVYLDVLKLVCREALQRAKICIVLDDLCDFMRRLVTGYLSSNMGPILHDIASSLRLLVIHETFAASFVENTGKIEIISGKLKEFNKRRRAKLAQKDSEIYGAMNKYMESILVLNKLEYRTHLNFHNQISAQFLYELNTNEEEARKTVLQARTAHAKESLVNELNILRQNYHITDIKAKIVEMTKEFDSKNEFFDGRMAYNKNSIEIMKVRLIDCTAKLDFFAKEMVALKQWDDEREIREREATLALITKQMKRKKRKKEKAKEQALADLSTAIGDTMEEMAKKEARKKQVEEMLNLK